MLQPTPHLLLRPAVASLAKLWSHPKAPLTSSDSRQLLNIIKTSFRQQLDQEHGNNSPQPAPSGSSPKPPAPNAEPLQSVGEPRPASNAPTATPVDRHLRDILSNPLFSFQPRPVRRGARDPMDVFEEACASGLMTVDRARACLHAKKRIIGGSLDKLGASGAGIQVFKWLLSTGAANDSSWLLSLDQENNKAPYDIIFEFLILEDRQEVLWILFEHYLTQRQPGVDLLLSHLSKNLGTISMNAAYTSLIKANDILLRLDVTENRRLAVLRSAVHRLVQTTTYGTPYSSRPSPRVFDQFLDLVEAVIEPPTPSTAYFLPRLHLCHPKRPNAKPALQYLKNLDNLKSLDETVSESLSSQPGVEPAPTFSPRVLWLALRSAKLLMVRRQYDEARWVMDFLQRRYPEVIAAGLDADSNGKLEHAEAEATNGQLLSHLQLGLEGT